MKKICIFFAGISICTYPFYALRSGRSYFHEFYVLISFVYPGTSSGKLS